MARKQGRKSDAGTGTTQERAVDLFTIGRGIEQLSNGFKRKRQAAVVGNAECDARHRTGIRHRRDG